MSDESINRNFPRNETLVSCPVCEYRETQIFFFATDRLHGIPGEYSYHSCPKWQTVFQNPKVVPENLLISMGFAIGDETVVTLQNERN